MLTVNELSTSDYMSGIMSSDNTRHYVDIKLSDKIVKMNSKHAIIHSILWKPYLTYGLHISSKDIYFDDTKPIALNGAFIARIQTEQYNKILQKRKDIDYTQLLLVLNSVVDDIWNFINEHLGSYVDTMSASMLYGLLQQPKVAKFAKMEFSDEEGTEVFEKRINKANKELIALLSDRTKLKNNPLINYMEIGSLKSNQIPQMMIAYGSRSDIDDSMMKHIISQSSLQGLKTAADYAVEYLSAKKAMWFSKKAIRATQYSARKHKLACASLKHIYPGDCNSKLTVPVLLKKQYRKAFMHKDIVVGSRIVTLNEHNIDNYVDKIVRLKSPLVCKHTDGFCEACAGRNGGHTIEYFPRNFHPGSGASSRIGGGTSQLILSTKHLISTNTISYLLPEAARKYFMKNKNDMVFTKKIATKLNHIALAIPVESIRGTLTDLLLEMTPNPATYSRISELMVLTANSEGVVPDVFMMSNSHKYFPHFSKEMLVYMKSIYQEIRLKDKMIVIPMHKWNNKNNIFSFRVIDDDMVAYAKQISSFTAVDVANYTSVSKALEAYMDVLYQKVNINVFFLEVVLRAFMIREPKVDYRIPVVTDIDDVYFGKLSEVIANRSVAVNLGFEELNRYISKPDTFTREFCDGPYNIFMGDYKRKRKW